MNQNDFPLNNLPLLPNDTSLLKPLNINKDDNLKQLSEKNEEKKEDNESPILSETHILATLQDPKSLSQKEILDLFNDIIKRICDAETWIIKGRSSPSTRQGWMIILARLINQFSLRTALLEYTSDINDEIKDVDEIKEKVPFENLNRFNTIIKEHDDDNTEDKKEIPKLLIKDSFTTELEESVKQDLCKFILNNFKLRHELATLWLHEEWYGDDRKRQAILRKVGKKKVKLPPRQYEKWLTQIMDGLHDVLEPKDKLFTKFLLDIPEIPPNIIKRNIKRYCESPERMPVGIYTLRNLIALRKANMKECLDLLLSYGENPDKSTRSNAIITLKRWIGDTELSHYIENYAVGIIKLLLNPSPPPSENNKKDENKEKEDDTKQEKETPSSENENNKKETDKNKKEKGKSIGWKENDIIRHLELYFAICSKKHELLSEIFELYPQLKDNIQRVIRIHIQPLIKSIGINSPKLLEVIRNFKTGADALAIRVLFILTEKCTKTTPELVNMVKDMYNSRDLNPKFLVPIFGALTKSEVAEYLPKLVHILNDTESQRKHVKDVILLIVDPTSRNPKTTQKPIMTPQELLVLLHNMESTVGLKRCSEATQICFSLPQIFKQEVLAVVLTQLVEQQPIPKLFMRTTIQTVNLYRNLTNFICTNILTQLIVKKVWTMPKLWEGFIRCLKITLPQSLNVILQLPFQQLKEVLTKVPDLKEPLKSHIKQLPKNQHSSKLDKVMEFLKM
jgi:symplekin